MKKNRNTDQVTNSPEHLVQDCSQVSFVSKHESDIKTKKLLHELQMHKTELTMQQQQLLATQAELTDSLSLYTELYDFAPVGYITLDQLGSIQNINLTGASMLGCPRADLIGKPLANSFTDKQSLLDYLWTACHTNINVIIELQTNLPCTDVTDVLLECRNINYTAESFCKLLTIMTDISERKKLERELQNHRDTMKMVFQQQVAFQTSASIAHNLLQPITAILAYSEVGLHYLSNDAKDEEKLRKVLTGNVEQTTRIGTIIQELLEFLESHLELATESLNLMSLISESLDMVKKVELIKFQYTVELEQNLDKVLVDAFYVKKALGNLIKASIDIISNTNSSQGEVTFNIHVQKNQNMAQITVKSNDLCLTPDVVKYAFEPFINLKETGIGMGLAITRALIEVNGGQLWLESESKTGTTFHFTLPFSP